MVPVSVQVLAPALWKPCSWALDLICETSKLALPLPPSVSVSTVLTTTKSTVMVELGRSSRVLVPPVNVMALAYARTGIGQVSR